MNKSELVAAIAKKTGESKAQEKRSLEALIDVIGEALSEGDDIRLVGFGRFRVVDVSSRNYRDPRTGKMIRTKKKKKVRFKAGSALQTHVN